MTNLRRRFARGMSGCAMLVALSGCSSGFVTVAPTPPVKYEKLGRVEGQGCGALGLLATAYYAIPLGLNGRVKEAYDQALAKAPGATSLVNVEIEESWAWVLLFTTRCTTIRGDAIKEVRS